MQHKRKRRWVGMLFLAAILSGSSPQWLHVNKSESIASGSPANGHLEKGWLTPYRGKNFRYFSPISYWLMGSGYTHSKVHRTLKESYAVCERTCPGAVFRLMECSRKKGGKMLIHYTHRNGLSVDFMVPKTRKGRQTRRYDHIGVWHYLLEFDPEGRLSFDAATSIDFESMARHLLALDDAARANGLRIRKVIFKLNLKDDLFKTPSGRQLQRRNIYFARQLPKRVDDVHDDHYHVDFEIR